MWSDEFEGSGLPDASKWNYEEGVLRNQELQYYTRERMENARVEDGKLIIETRKEKIDGHHYTSASLITKGKAEWCYGRFEIRAKLPTGKGMWPAIWLLGAGYPEHTRWPECGEIDIMENVGFDPDMIHANIHTKAYNHAIGTNKGDKMTVAAPHADFHIYALEWFEEHMDFFVDNIKYFTFDNEKSGNDVWPFDKPFYLILNAAYGGSWGGAQGVDETILPQRYEIDYVRIYQWK
ncbi:MAG: glycoside hydrolase family 16 protein [Calditrichaeota bacterium]|nr:MAG: glycoside hydrolase family 16 protein [Calditrichota bacterium]